MSVNVGTAVAFLTLDRSGMKNGLKAAGADLKNFAKGTGGAEERIKSLGSAMTGAGAVMAKKLTIPLAGAGAVATKASMNFGAQMSKVKAISGATGSDFNKLREQAIKLGADTAFSASEAAEGMENLASAGFSVNEIMQAMPGMLDLAAAGDVSIADASDIASSALRGFGMEADKTSHVSDVLAKTAADTNAGITDTGEAMKYVAPVAHSLGISFEDTAAAIGLLSNAGIQGSQAGTTLRSALTNLASPTKRASKVMQELGMNFFDAQGKMLPLGQIIQQLQDKTKGLTEQQKASAMETLFGKEAMSGMLALVDQGPDKFNKLTKGLKNCDGEGHKMATTMQDNLKGSIEELKGSLETALISIGDVLAPTIKKIANFIKILVNAFNSLPKPVQKVIVNTGLLLAALGPVLLILGKLVSSVGLVGGAFAKLGRAASAFLKIPAMVSKGGKGTLTALSVLKKGINTIFKGISKSVTGGIKVFSKIPLFAKKCCSGALKAFQLLGKGVGKIFSGIGKAISKGVSIFAKLPALLRPHILLTVSLIAGIGLIVYEVIKNWDELKKAAENLFKHLEKVFSKIGDFFKKSVEGWKLTFKGLGDFFFKVGHWITDGLLGGLKKGCNKVKSFIGKMANGIKSTFKNILGIHSPSKEFQGYGKFITLGLIEGLKEGQPFVDYRITQLGKNIKRIFKEGLGIHSPSKEFKMYGKFIDEGLAKGLDENSLFPEEAIRKNMEKMQQAIQDTDIGEFTWHNEQSNESIRASKLAFEHIDSKPVMGTKEEWNATKTKIKLLNKVQQAQTRTILLMEVVKSGWQIIGRGWQLLIRETTGYNVGLKTAELQNQLNKPVKPKILLPTNANILKPIKANISKAIKATQLALNSTSKRVAAFLNKSKQGWSMAAKDVEKTVTKHINTMKKKFNDLNKIPTVKIGKNIMKGFILGIESLIENAGKTISRVADRVIYVFETEFGIHSPSRVFYGFGCNIVEGLINGIKSMFRKVSNVITSLANKVKSGFKELLGINSPSRIFFQYGGFIGEGLIQGIDGQEGAIESKFKGLANKIKSLGNVKPDFDFRGLNNLALSGTYGSGSEFNNISNSNKNMGVTQNVKMYITIPNADKEGAQKIATEFKSMTQASLKDEMTELFMNDVLRD